MKTPVYVYVPTYTMFRAFCSANGLTPHGSPSEAVMIRCAGDIRGLGRAPLVMAFNGHCLTKADVYLSGKIAKALLAGHLVDHTDKYITKGISP